MAEEMPKLHTEEWGVWLWKQIEEAIKEDDSVSN